MAVALIVVTLILRWERIMPKKEEVIVHHVEHKEEPIEHKEKNIIKGRLLKTLKPEHYLLLFTLAKTFFRLFDELIILMLSFLASLAFSKNYSLFFS